MKTNMIKELFIMILLFIVIMFAFGILFYDSISSTSQAISSIEYQTSEEVNTALEEIEKNSGMSDEDKANQVLKSYSIDEADLVAYEADNSYTSGKKDPFSENSSPEEAIPPATNTSTNTAQVKNYITATTENIVAENVVANVVSQKVETEKKEDNKNEVTNKEKNNNVANVTSNTTPGKYFENKSSK